MTDISSRRRWSGRLLIGAAALALPLTGSISYAQDEVPPAPPAAPEAPVAPVAPAALPAPVAAPPPPARIVSRDGETRVIRIERRAKDKADEARGERKRIEKRVVIRDGHEMTAEERADFEQDMKDHREDMAELDRDLAEMHRELAANRAEIDREVRLAVAEAHRSRPQVRVQCRSGQRDVTETVAGRDGDTIYVCQSAALAEARNALASARAEIARSRDLTATQRAEALRSIEQAERGVRAD